MKIELDVPDDVLRSILVDFFPPITEDDRLEFQYDSGSVWCAFDLANAVAASVSREDKIRLIGEDAVVYREGLKEPEKEKEEP